AISDNGMGISPTEQEKVFDPLYTTKNNGTGLGLAICRDIIQKHHGSIFLQSEIGRGTTVKISLPK
ncbi:MAG: ATP-binding protein, partial [Thermincolia bacterium]